MNIKKFFVFVICFGLIANAIAQNVSKNPTSTSDVSPELKEKALSLLNNLLRFLLLKIFIKKMRNSVQNSRKIF